MGRDLETLPGWVFFVEEGGIGVEGEEELVSAKD